MFLSIVIPAFNEEKLLPRCLESVHAAIRAVAATHGELGEEDFEIIVTDNNSTDRTGEIARDAGARVVFEPINQIARARNAGAARARGAWLLFIDADSLLGADNLGAVVDAAASGQIVGGGCIVGLDEMPFSARALLGLWNVMSRCLKWAAGSFIFCSLEAFQAIDGFCLDFYAAEEIDISKRLKRYGKPYGKRFVILTRSPHVSSARKMHLYSGREQVAHLLRCLFSMRRTVRNRERLDFFYDGRR